MTYFHAFILSLVEGLTEFLPVSSTGHLILTARALNLAATDFTKTFEIVIQLGAILAIVGLYLPQTKRYLKLWDKLFLAFLPSAIVGFFLYPFIKGYLLSSAPITLIALFVGGFLLIILEYFHHEKDTHLSSVHQITYPQAFTIGFAQTFSIIPGVSRAAASIAGGLLAGLKHTAAVEFSFLLALPTIFAATVLDLTQTSIEFNPYHISLLVLGLVISYFSALLSIKFLLRFTQNHGFVPFGIYRILLAFLYYLIVIR